jgi:hypothetical protein
MAEAFTANTIAPHVIVNVEFTHKLRKEIVYINIIQEIRELVSPSQNLSKTISYSISPMTDIITAHNCHNNKSNCLLMHYFTNEFWYIAN